MRDEVCLHHSEHNAKITRNEKDIQKIWDEIERVDGRINGMIKLLIGTLSTTVLTLIAVITNIVIKVIN